jgi:hypothetical protein
VLEYDIVIILDASISFLASIDILGFAAFSSSRIFDSNSCNGSDGILSDGKSSMRQRIEFERLKSGAIAGFARCSENAKRFRSAPFIVPESSTCSKRFSETKINISEAPEVESVLTLSKR